MDIGFSINRYDRDGDIVDNGIMIHIEDTVIVRFSSVSEIDEVIQQLTDIRNEIVLNKLA